MFYNSETGSPIYHIGDKFYDQENPGKKIVNIQKKPKTLLYPGDVANLSYTRHEVDGTKNTIYEHAFSPTKLASIDFEVTTFDDGSYEMKHSVEYIKERK